MRHSYFSRVLRSLLLAVAIMLPQVALAASSWNPTLLVNTESFQVIDEGDGTTNVELRFGGTLDERLLFNRTKGMFQFTDDLSVQGTISGSTLRIDGNADFWGTLAASGTIVGKQGITAKGALSGNTLRISGAGEINGPLAVSGALRTDGDATINDDRTTSADAVLTFGNSTTNQTLKFIHTSQKFEFSKDLKVIGNLSGSSLNIDGNANVRGSLSASGTVRTDGNLSGNTLNVDGTINWRGITYTAPTSQSANTFLKTDGAGGLSWASAAVGNGSGQIMSLHPEYPNAVYFASGSTTVGQLAYSYDSTNKQNYYRWVSSKAALQDYWIALRVRVPDNFSSWDVVKPLEFRYRTGSGQITGSYLNVKMLDTTGAAVTLTGGSQLANTSWTTANITGPQAAGTWTPKGFFTILIKMAGNTTTSPWTADAGYLNLNYETTTP